MGKRTTNNDGVTTKAGRALSPEEEARFRVFLRAGPPPHVTDGQAWRLLATLDAVRSECAQAVENERRRLYEAVKGAATNVDADDYQYGDWDAYEFDREGYRDAIIAAVLALLAPPAEEEQT